MSGRSYQNEQLKRGSYLQHTRHLIALIDGTWVSASRKDGDERYSNVYKMGLFIETHNEANESQISFYLPGLGSGARGLKYLDGIFSVSLFQDVEQAYINLCSNYAYHPGECYGDKLYIFGFSRGAVVARHLIAIIGKYGLLKASQIEMFKHIWSDYISERCIPDLVEFKQMYGRGAHQPKIEFVGLFDTVYGYYMGPKHRRLNKIFFGNRILGSHVKAAVHLLARDETRRAFLPVLFESASSVDQRLEQIWMPGVHADIGGGYAADFLSNIALMTMLDRVREHTELKIDFERSMILRQYIEEELADNRIIVNDEAYGIFMLGPFRWGGTRRPNGSDQYQAIHPIYKILNGRSYLRKSGRTRFFSMPEFPFQNYAAITSLENLHRGTD